MLKPLKHTNLDTCLLNCISEILAILTRASGPVPYPGLKKLLCDRVGNEILVHLPYALGFLFLLGKLDFHAASDSVFLTNTKALADADS